MVDRRPQEQKHPAPRALSNQRPFEPGNERMFNQFQIPKALNFQ